MKTIDPKFSTAFDSYVCEGDSITCELDGFTFTARIVRDDDSHIDDGDSHNVDQSVTGCNEEQQGRLLKCRQAWFNDEWFYCSVVIDASFNGVELGEYLACLSSIAANYPDNDNAYLTEVANELLPEAMEAAQKALDTLREKVA